jgi:malonyl-CoA/methylmalonyl-CoA synthetase
MPCHFLEELRATFADRSAAPALVHAARTLTFGELDERARRWAGRLQSLGVRPGDRVALSTAEKTPFLIAHLGALYAGAISLPVNPRLAPEEVRYILADSGAAVVIGSAGQQSTIERLRGALPALRAILADREVLDPPRISFNAPALGTDDPCILLYSSGTTGRPKGVVHTHSNLASSLHALQAAWRITRDDVIVNVLPLFHIHGLSFATHLAWLAGACLKIDDAFHPRKTLELVGQGTVFMAVPTFYYAFLERPEFRAMAEKWDRVRLFTCGSAPIRAEVLPELESILGRHVINRYGMTESHVITSLPLDGPWPYGSVGLPLDGVAVRVANDQGEPAAAGEMGSVLLRGPNLFRAYWQNPESTRAAFATGWFDTGDLGTRDERGFLTLVGRKHDLIITHGFNVYPQVVERVLCECAGVRESAVIGLPDERRGERVVAVVVRSDPACDERTIKDHCRERLADYERPAAIVFAESLPRNALGKVLRRELRAQLAGDAGDRG